jgi:hypothetical protein
MRWKIAGLFTLGDKMTNLLLLDLLLSYIGLGITTFCLTMYIRNEEASRSNKSFLIQFFLFSLTCWPLVLLMLKREK